MPLFEKHFTLPEARAWLPELRRRFARIHQLYAELQDLRAEHERAQNIIRSNGHAPKTTPFEARAAEMQTLLREIAEAGIEIKDVGRGLVDFPHWRGDTEVFLCWELAEDDIRFWHPIEEGYAGRRPLQE